MASNIRIVITALEQFYETVIKKLVLGIVSNLVSAPGEGGTPVDTGWARANWVPSIGPGHSGVIGSPDAVSTGAQQAGLATVATSKQAIRIAGVSISNNVPYIVRLNEGSSKQAPRGFVQRAIRKAVKG